MQVDHERLPSPPLALIYSIKPAPIRPSRIAEIEKFRIRTLWQTRKRRGDDFHRRTRRSARARARARRHRGRFQTSIFADRQSTTSPSPSPQDQNLPCCAVHAATVRPPELCPLFAACEQSVFWSSQLRCTAEARSLNVFPSTSNGRLGSVDVVIGGAGTLPRAPVNDYRESVRCERCTAERRRTCKFSFWRAMTPNPTCKGKLPSAVPVASASVVARSRIRIFCIVGLVGWCRFDVLITSRGEIHGGV